MNLQKRKLIEKLAKANPYLLEAGFANNLNEEHEHYQYKQHVNSTTSSGEEKKPVNTTNKKNRVLKSTNNLTFRLRKQKKTINENPTESHSGVLDEVIKEHDAGLKGNKQSVKNAYDQLKKLYEQQPNHKEIKAYFGSATCLIARDTHSVTDKMKFALEGLSLLDELIESDSDCIVARFLRGHVAYRLPDLYFQRSKTAIEDFSYLVEVYEKNSTILNDDEYTEILKNLVEVYKRSNQIDMAKNYQEKLRAFKMLRNPSINNTELDSEQDIDGQIEMEGMTDEAFSIYSKALNGTSDEVKEALDFFEVFVLTNSSPEVEMYYIDLQSMLGRDSINTYEMFGAAIKSMKAMDSLITEHPDLNELKLIRSRQSLRLPELFFRRAAIASADIECLIKNQEFLEEKGSEIHHQLLFDLGIAYEKLGMIQKAKEAWAKLNNLNPSMEIQEKLEEKKEIYAYKKIDLRTLTVATKDKLYEKAKEMHFMGAKGCKDAAIQSLEAWEKARNAFPECETAQTYYAASVALMGKFANDPQEMFKDTIRGIKLLNESIHSENPELKYLRGVIYQSLPEGFFHTSDKAIKDFKAVKSAYEQNLEKPPITREQYLKLLYDLGHLYKKTSLIDLAEKTWSALYKEDSESMYVARLKARGMTFE
ncbi:hypothetical protein JOC75_000151 [Metabacillus crassostreae]|uniref:hypothetical protein n=1 Tax=Metabacillus crassostreae TaxID=929098 RepID=UPI00195DC329|nr:hypothetical protein [Metabacillus crassostreae]MBM7602181.1 hypothetical protein [Metabacillus crassostreae]